MPHGALQCTLLIAALGAAALTCFWVLSHHHDRGPAEAASQ